MTGKRLEGKVAIVTGGGSGFGRAVSQRFAAEGCNILIGDLNPDTAKETAQSISGSDSTISMKMDVTAEADWKAAVDAAVKKWGKIDCVVNNAGTSYKNKPTAEVTEAEYDRVMNVNVKSVFWSIKHCIPELKKAGGGSITNISSIGSKRPRPGLVWYNSSKGAVSNATMGLAAEYGADQIRINAICPLLSGTGLFETFVGVPHTPENVKNFIGAVPLGRLTNPMDVANACLFFACDEGAFCTGVCLEVDGGKGI